MNKLITGLILVTAFLTGSYILIFFIPIIFFVFAKEKPRRREVVSKKRLYINYLQIPTGKGVPRQKR